MKLKLFPAVDITNGELARVENRKDGGAFGHSPIDYVRYLVDSGAEWIHIADLDLAFGRGNNRELVKEIIDGFPQVNFQLSGGIKNQEAMEFALSTGAKRINLAAGFLRYRDVLKEVAIEHGERISISLDVENERIISRGENEDFGELLSVMTSLEEMDIKRYLVTDVSRDGGLAGPNLGLLRQVLGLTARPIIASGGVSKLSDITSLRGLVSSGLEGLVLGSALLANRFTFAEALQIANG